MDNIDFEGTFWTFWIIFVDGFFEIVNGSSASSCLKPLFGRFLTIFGDEFFDIVDGLLTTSCLKALFGPLKVMRSHEGYEHPWGHLPSQDAALTGRDTPPGSRRLPKEPCKTGCWTGPPRGERAPRVARVARPHKSCLPYKGTSPKKPSPPRTLQ